jgi:hypothetical protein
VCSSDLICDVEHLFGVDGRVVLGNSSTCGRNAHNNRLPEFAAGYMVGVGGVDTGVLANPAIAFASAPVGNVMTLGAADATLVNASDPDVMVMQSLNVACPLSSNFIGPEDYSFMNYDGAYYRHEPTTKFIENTLENPAINPPTSFAPHPRERKGNGLTCPSAPKTFLNRDSCVRRPNCVTPPEYDGTTFVLDEAMLLAMYSSSANRHAHYMDGLVFRPGSRTGYNPFDPALTASQWPAGTLMASPCTSSSRWRKLSASACAAESILDDATKASIRAALQASADPNPNMKDILTVTGTCSGDDVIESSVTVGGECWQHTHPANLNVYDFTAWVAQNPIAPSIINAFQENPVPAFAWRGDAMKTHSVETDRVTWEELSVAYLRGHSNTMKNKARGKLLRQRGTPELKPHPRQVRQC